MEERDTQANSNLCKCTLMELRCSQELYTDTVSATMTNSTPIFNHLHIHYLLFVFFTNTQSWQCWHYCHLCIPKYLQFSALLGHYDFSKYEIIYLWVWENCIPMLYFPWVQLFCYGTAKTKLAMLAFIFVKNSNLFIECLTMLRITCPIC